eukprot:SAG11_NODE_9245_length_929_cov_1.300000_2_plen_49_part_01
MICRIIVHRQLQSQRGGSAANGGSRSNETLVRTLAKPPAKKLAEETIEV